MLIQRSFQINKNDWNILFEIATKEKKSASNIIRNLIHNFIVEKEKEDINLFLKKQCEFVSEEEEKEIINTLKNKKSYQFTEVSIDDLQN